MKRLAAGIGLAAVLLIASSGQASTVPSQVVAGGYQYLPTVIVLQSGASLSFTNLDTALHSVTSTDADPDTGRPLFDSGLTSLGSTRAVSRADRLAPNLSGYAFRCQLHPSMTGTLIVTA